MLRARITGDRDLEHRLKVTVRGLDGMEPTHRRTAALVAAAARSRAPKRTGRLAGTVNARATRKAAVITFGTAYGGPIHWGWPNRPNRGQGWRGGPIRANPFASRAAQQVESGWTRFYSRAVDRLLNGDSQI